MTTTNFDVIADGWISNYSGGAGPNMGNGKGPRLQTGFGSSAGETWNMRSYINFLKPVDATIPDNAIIDACTMFAKVRPNNSCWSKGSAPKLLIQRPTDTTFNPGENPQAGECNGSGSGTARYPWAGGSAPTTTHMVFWEGTPASGDVIDFDLTAMFKDWWAARSGTQDNFLVYLLPSNATGTAEQDTSANRNLAFHSADADGAAIFAGGLGPYLAVDWHLPSSLPNAPGLTAPANGTRLAGGTTRDFSGTYSPPAGASTAYEIEVVWASSSHVSAGGVLDTGLLGSVSALFTTGSWSFVGAYFPTQAHGSTYYWQARATESPATGAGQGPGSAVRSWVVNRVPVNTKVRPT